MRSLDFAVLIARIRRTLQKPDHAEAGEHGEAEERGRLPACERLGASDQVVEVAVADAIGNNLDLGCGSSNVGRSDREVGFELAGGTTHRAGEIADILRSRTLLLVHRLLDRLAGLRSKVLCRVSELGRGV